MMRIDIAQLQMLREAAKERSRHIAERMHQIEADRLRLWTRMNRLRAELDAQKHEAGRTAWEAGDDVRADGEGADVVAAGGEDGVRSVPA